VFLRFIHHISRRTVHAVGLFLILIVIFFFSLTRTQVGRDALSAQIESSFNEAFEGSLSIGKLTGNLLYTLYATDVRLSDPTGVVVADVDSVVIEPGWIDLLRQKFTISRIAVINPRIFWTASEDGGSKLSSALRVTRRDSLPVDSPWSFNSAVIQIRGGQFTAENSGNEPDTVKQIQIFDYANAQVYQVNLDARLDWTDGVRQIDILDFTAVLKDPELSISGGQSQIVFDSSGVNLNQLFITFGDSDISLSGFLGLSVSGKTLSWEKTPFSLDVEASRLSFDRLANVFPGLGISSTADIALHIQGPVEDLTLSWLRLTHDDASIEVSGTAKGFPDGAEFEASVTSARLPVQTLREWFPSVAYLDRVGSDTVSLGLYATGSATLSKTIPILNVTAVLDLDSPGGTVSATMQADGPVGDSLRYEIESEINGIDLTSWTGNEQITSSLSGSVHVSGVGLDVRRADTDMSARLTDFRLGTLYVPGLTIFGASRAGHVSSTVTVRQRNGSMQLEAVGNLFGYPPDFSFYLVADHADVGSLTGRDSLSSDLNMSLQLSGSGTEERSLVAELSVTVDSSSIALGGRSSDIDPHSQRIVLRRRSDPEPRFSLRGDLVDADISGDFTLSAIASLASAWSDLVSGAIRDEAAKPLYGSPPVEQVGLDLRETILWDVAESALRRDNLEAGATLEVTADIHRADILTGYWPTFTSVTTRGHLSVKSFLTTERFTTDLTFTADSLAIGVSDLSGLSATGGFIMNRSNELGSILRFDLEVFSDSMLVGSQNVYSPDLRATFKDGTGRFALTANRVGRLDSLSLSGNLGLLPDRNELTIENIRMSGGESIWEIDGQRTIDLYSDAIMIHDVSVLQSTRGEPTGQAVWATGTYSDNPADTLQVQTSGINLYDISRFFAVDKAIGGLLDASLDLTKNDFQLQVQGTVDIEHISLENRILGNLSVESRIRTGSKGIGVNLSLTPPDSITNPVIIGTDLPARVLSNNVSFGGVIELPGSLADGSEFPGRIAADVDLERADIFFFEYIFNETSDVSGFARGNGRITGSIYKPVFDIEARIIDSHFSIPKIGMKYDMTGSVRIDGEAINLIDFRLTDPTGGVGTLGGKLLFNNYQFFTFDMSGKLDRFQMMNLAFSDELPFYGFLWTSGTLTIDGPLFGATLRSTDAETTSNSHLYIPVTETAVGTDNSYIVFADSVGHIPDFRKLASRPFLLSKRPDAERRFIDALDMDLNITAPPGSIVHLVIDPLLGDEINAISSGRMQIRREQGEFLIFGTLQVSGGDYQFTAGEVFFRKFIIDAGGTITWSGDPINAALNIPATYRTRASRAGLTNVSRDQKGLIPLIINLQITGTVDSPAVDLSLAIDRSNQNVLGDYQAIEAQLNQPDRATEYATSVLLTNSFQLTTDNLSTNSGGQLAFNSVSQLVSSQVNRFVNEALPNVDFSFGLQGENAQDLDVTYGLALRLMDEKLIIRGEGVYQGSRSNADNVSTRLEGLQGEFVVEVKLNPNVSVEVFYRREGDILQSTDLTNTTGAGVSYQTEFSAWNQLWNRLFGWITPDNENKQQ
jgi:translocation and assembly module TamB